MPFTEVEVAVKQLDKNFWELLDSVEYEGRFERFKVPKGFRTDFASVPQILTWLIPRYGIYTKSAILHDYLLRERIVPPADADGIFRRTMQELNVPFFRRWMMWTAVRVFGTHLKGLTFKTAVQITIMMLVSITSLTIPVAVLGISLVIFWISEWIAYAFFLLIKRVRKQRKRLNPPDILGPIEQ